MNKIFIGGSRHVSRLPPRLRERLDNVVTSGHQVIVGDATGPIKPCKSILWRSGTIGSSSSVRVNAPGTIWLLANPSC